MAARRYGTKRLRRGAAGTAVAAAAMAALGASQAPGFLPVAHAATHEQQSGSATTPSGEPIDGGSPYVTELPPLNTPVGPVAPGNSGGGSNVTVPGGGASLPTTVLAAYERAQAAVAQSDPGCHLPWQLLAAIGQVESGQARGGAVDANGTTLKPILGPVLDGNGFADITDTDSGKYDGDAVHDRAVGPMQFIPSTWRAWGADGNGDGVSDPNNVYDAALAAAHYLCADDRNLAVPADMDRAILGYNHSQDYLNLVMAWYEHFRAGGAVTVPDSSGTPGPGIIPPPASTSTGGTSTPSGSGSASPSPSPTKSVSGSVGPTGSSSPTSSPTGGSPTSPPSSDPTGGGTTTPPTTDPTSGDPTSPGCPTDSGTPTPTGSGTTTPTATPTGTDTPTTTPDPCDTDGSGTTSPTPDPSDTAGVASGAAL